MGSTKPVARHAGRPAIAMVEPSAALPWSWVQASARLGATFFFLWGAAHVAGGALQLMTLSSGGGSALTAMIATAHPAPVDGFVVSPPAAAFMGMGAWNILWIGAFVCLVAVRMNWRNSAFGLVLNTGVVAATDAGLLVALLLPGHMAWGDGAVGLVLFALAAPFATIAVFGARRRGVTL